MDVNGNECGEASAAAETSLVAQHNVRYAASHTKMPAPRTNTGGRSAIYATVHHN
jgi:hypothetical protein